MTIFEWFATVIICLILGAMIGYVFGVDQEREKNDKKKEKTSNTT